jgi:hypothetical protein
MFIPDRLFTPPLLSRATVRSPIFAMTAANGVRLSANTPMPMAFSDLPVRSVFRLAAGFAIAPLVAGATMFIVALFAWSAELNLLEGRPADPVDGAMSLGLAVVLLAVAAAAAGALPGLALMITRRIPLTLGRVLVLGGLVGQLPFVAIVAGVIVGPGDSRRSLS